MPEHDLLAPTLLGAVGRRKGLTALVMVLFALLGLGYALSQKAIATASASFVVSQPTDAATDANFVNDQVSIIQFASTADAAAKLLKTSFPTSTLTGDDVLADEKVLAGATSNLITVQFSDGDPALAQAGADSLVRAYQNLLAATASANLTARTAQFQSTIKDLQQQIAAAGGPTTVTGAPLAASLAAQIQSLSQVQSVGGSAPTVVNSSTARLPKASRALAPAAGLVLGGIVGLLPAVGLVYILAQTRRKFTDRFQPEMLLQRQLLSEIPEFVLEGLRSDVPAADATHSSSAEAFRFVSTALDDRAQGDGPLVVAVSGGSSLDGKTTVAANLAVTFARRGLRTIAIDADLDGHGLGFLLLGEKRHAPGLAEVLAGRASLSSVVQPALEDIDPDLQVLPAGLLHGPAITDLVSKAGLRKTLDSLGRAVDVLVLDVPSPLQVAYASSVLAAVGRCLVVVPHGSSPAKLQEFTVRVTALGVDPIGYVYTKAPLRRELGQLSRYVTDKRRVPFAESAEAPREVRLSPGQRPGDDAPLPVAPAVTRFAAPPGVDHATWAAGLNWESRFANAANELHAIRPLPRNTDVLPVLTDGAGAEAPWDATTDDIKGDLEAPSDAPASIAINLKQPAPVQKPYPPVTAAAGPSTSWEPAPSVAPEPEVAEVAETHDAGVGDEPASRDGAPEATSSLPSEAPVATGPRVRKRTRSGSWATVERP